MKSDRKFTSTVITANNLPKIRWLAWILLCALSVFFSEVVSGNTPSVFVNIYGLLVITPLYFLHLMVLLPLVFRTGKPAIATLYLAGALFGLYEAYITKVIWSPVDYPVDLYLGGAAVCSTLMLVLFWHPIMSWIVPLFTADGLLNSHRTLKINLPLQWLRRIKPMLLIAVLGAVMGIIHGASMSELAPALFSALSSTLIIWLLIRLWKHVTGRTIFTLAQLLPSPKQWKVFVFLLAAYYIVLGFVLRPDAFPPFVGHITVAVMYVVIGGLLFLSRRTEKKTLLQAADVDPSAVFLKISSKSWLVFSGAFISLSAVASILQDWSRQGIHYILWGLGIAAGVVLFGWSAFRVIQKLDIHIKLPHIRRSFAVRNERILTRKKNDIFERFRNFHLRLPKINLDLSALVKKITSISKLNRIHRVQR